MTGISANGLYKIFGKNPKRGVDALHSGVSRAQLREDGLTAAVIDASFEVVPGEVFVVMGLSGSGKSTLIRMVNGLHPATAGELRLGGHVITDMSEAELRAVRRDKISMVFQNFALLPHRTVRENAAYGLEIKGVNKSEREEQAHKALQMVGLEGWEHYRPDELSGGMKQRVGLARALANDTDILLMDEAFSALDPLIRKEMQDHLMNLQQELGKTVLFITHDLNEAMRIGDRIAVMRDGRIEQIGTAGEILREPANDYVAQFIHDVDRSRVLLAGDICESLTTPLVDETTAGTENIVAADTPVSQLFARAARHEQPLVVKNSDGGIDGIITKETLLAAVADHSETSEEGGR